MGDGGWLERSRGLRRGREKKVSSDGDGGRRQSRRGGGGGGRGREGGRRTLLLISQMYCTEIRRPFHNSMNSTDTGLQIVFFYLKGHMSY